MLYRIDITLKEAITKQSIIFIYETDDEDIDQVKQDVIEQYLSIRIEEMKPLC